MGLGYRLGSDALLVLLDLAAHATDSPEGIVVTASYRDIARRLGVSKDTVGRRLAVLRRAGVVVELADLALIVSRLAPTGCTSTSLA